MSGFFHGGRGCGHNGSNRRKRWPACTESLPRRLALGGTLAAWASRVAAARGRVNAVGAFPPLLRLRRRECERLWRVVQRHGLGGRAPHAEPGGVERRQEEQR